MVQPVAPSADWPNHDGTPNSPGDVYPLAPPPEIGRVISATTFLTGSGLKSSFVDTGKRATHYAIACALVGLLVPGLILGVVAYASTQSVLAFALVALTVGVLVFLAAKPLMKTFIENNIAVCSFIGTEGFARVCGLRTPRATVVRFSRMAAPRVTERRLTAAGAHVNTSVDFVFVGTDGRQLLRILANKPKDGSRGTDEYGFGVAAVEAWQKNQRHPT